MDRNDLTGFKKRPVTLLKPIGLRQLHAESGSDKIFTIYLPFKVSILILFIPASIFY